MSTRHLHRFSLPLIVLTASGIATSAFAQTPEAGSTRSPATATSEPGRPDDMSMKDRAEKKKVDKASAMPISAQSFVTQAATTDMAEIEFGQLAMKNSKDPEVKKFAEQMVKDHTATAAKLKTLAAKDNLVLPTALDAEHAAIKSKLAGLQGADFDKEYGKTMAKGHDQAVALFESATQTPQVSADLKQFAVATLPKLKEHKGKAHELHADEGA